MVDKNSYRIKIGDRVAFELFYKTHFVHICIFSNKYLHNAEESRDVAQEVFIKIWQNRENIDPGESLKSLVFKIASNECINRLRHRKVKNNYEELYKIVYVDYQENTPHESLIALELSEYISQAISRIPPKCRKIFDLNRIEGMRYNEIASELQISVKTVEAHISKALRILRYELRNYLKLVIVILLNIFFCT